MRIESQILRRQGLQWAIQDGKTAQSVPGATEGSGPPVAGFWEFA
jgi:hypothetical protein